jgi:Fe(3+) dicitrate transport protein
LTGEGISGFLFLLRLSLNNNKLPKEKIMKIRSNRNWTAAGVMAGWVLVFTASRVVGQDAFATLAPMTVVGSREEVFKSAGSAAFVTMEEIRRASGTGNLNQVLNKVPGVYVRDEDGFGAFPNISLRGADGTRSEKVTIMEDGILSAPSPYSAPAAYYTPRVARMAGVEVLKGSSQVRYGPQTTGGVVNFLSTPIPEQQAFFARTTYGSYNTWFGHAHYGDTVETDAGRFGYLLELHGGVSDGFRDVRGGGDSGFSLFEPMLKMSFEPKTALKQRIEMKVGYTDYDADETYTGLAEQDLKRNPNDRYAATQFDRFTSDHWRTYLKWIAEPSDALRFESALYYNEFSRNWDKLDQVNRSPIHQQILTPGGLATLNGLSPGGPIRLTANLRDHEAYGWQNQANVRFETGTVAHDVALGLRLHYDKLEGRQYRTNFTSNGTGGFNLVNRTATVGTGMNETFATAVFVEDKMEIGALTLVPGVRYEYLDMGFTPEGGGKQSIDEEMFMAGVGANYKVDETHSVFGGVYQGASTPSPQAYLAGTDNEESIGYELGWRHRRDTLNVEFAGFFTDFDQLISTDAGQGLNPGSARNAGQAEVWGVESIVQYDAGAAAGIAYGLPMYLSATWTSAEFEGTTPLLDGGGGAIYAGGRAGNEIPYVPEWKLAAGIGLEAEKWGVNLDAVHTSSTWGTGYNGDVRPGTPTARDGRIPSLLLFSLGGYYRIHENVKLLAGIDNLFDEQEITSRVPEGPRTNAPRMVYAGLEAQF